VLAKRVAEGETWPSSSELAEFNGFLGGLTAGQREQASKLLTKAREGGIHDTLVVLSERMNLKDLRFVENGVALPHEPHGTEIYFDWTARCAGEAWPNDR
jgi:hypothetical protein